MVLAENTLVIRVSITNRQHKLQFAAQVALRQSRNYFPQLIINNRQIHNFSSQQGVLVN